MTDDRATWTSRLREIAPPPAVDPGGRAVVVSAHPDDEVIALGSWLVEQIGRDLVFVVATDGEASHPGSPTVSPDALRDLRHAELLGALRRLGHVAPAVERLGLPDGALRNESGALAERLGVLLEGADLVLAPYELDGHDDHDVVGEVVREVAPAAATVWRYPVWRWEWTRPDGDDRWLADARVLPHAPAARLLKAAALRRFRTQVTPLSAAPEDQQVVPQTLLDHVLEAPEVVLT